MYVQVVQGVHVCVCERVMVLYEGVYSLWPPHSSNMGPTKGLVVFLNLLIPERDFAQKLIITHCFSHQLALIGKHASEKADLADLAPVSSMPARCARHKRNHLGCEFEWISNCEHSTKTLQAEARIKICGSCGLCSSSEHASQVCSPQTQPPGL